MIRRDDATTAAPTALIGFENGLRELRSPAASPTLIRTALGELGRSTLRLLEEGDAAELRRAVELAEVYGNILAARDEEGDPVPGFDTLGATPRAIYGSLCMASSIVAAKVGKV